LLQYRSVGRATALLNFNFADDSTYHRHKSANILVNDQLNKIKTGSDHWLQIKQPNNHGQ